jgi:hypothetical protein
MSYFPMQSVWRAVCGDTGYSLLLTALVVLGIPVFLSDGFSSYQSALVEVYHQNQSISG